MTSAARWLALAAVLVACSDGGGAAETNPPDEPDSEIVAVETIAQPEVGPETVAETVAEVVEPEIVATATIAEVVAPKEVALTSTPAGASVLVDGKDVGQTPLSVALPTSGEHTVTLKKAGYRTETRTLTATSGDLAVPMRLLRPRSDAPPLVP